MLSNAQLALRDMISESELLAPLLGLTHGNALLHGSRDGPMGLSVGAGRYGRHGEALVRANLRQAGRHLGVAEAYRALVSALVEGLQVRGGAAGRTHTTGLGLGARRGAMRA